MKASPGVESDCCGGPEGEMQCCPGSEKIRGGGKLTLAKIRHGRPVEVVALPNECGRTCRLATLGFLPGTRVCISRVAPLGDPISVKFECQEISVRLSEASLIEVVECAV